MEEGQFDFHEVSEEEEQLDYNKLIPCPHCGKPIPHNATLCLYCGESTVTPSRPRWIVWVAIGVIVVFLLFFVLRA